MKAHSGYCESSEREGNIINSALCVGAPSARSTVGPMFSAGPPAGAVLVRKRVHRAVVLDE